MQIQKIQNSNQNINFNGSIIRNKSVERVVDELYLNPLDNIEKIKDLHIIMNIINNFSEFKDKIFKLNILNESKFNNHININIQSNNYNETDFCASDLMLTNIVLLMLKRLTNFENLKSSFSIDYKQIDLFNKQHLLDKFLAK
ncbi:MAG: hypothetical protein MJ237_01185 [bacterium]|nr:hypothetical protein [bacterium]